MQAHSNQIDWLQLPLKALVLKLDDPEYLCLVKECHELEAHFETNFTDSILSDTYSVNPSEMKLTNHCRT